MNAAVSGQGHARYTHVSTYTELAVVLNSLFIIFFDVVREVVDGNVVIINVFHDLLLSDIIYERVSSAIDIRSYPLLETAKLSWGQRVSLANDRDDIDARRKSPHQLNIHLTKAAFSNEQGWHKEALFGYSRVTSGWDEIEKDMNTVVPEPRITLDTGLLGENIIVLTLEVSDDFLEAIRG